MRQGCPLSVLLVIIIAEVLALRIKQNKDIHGLQIPINNITNDQEIKITQYADDTVIFVNSLTSMRSVMKEIDYLGELAGVCVNWGKSNAMCLGNEHIDACSVDEIKVSNEPIKYLGITHLCWEKC